MKDVWPESCRHKLLDVCKARWIQRLGTIKTNAEKSWNADSTKKAVSHYHAIANLEFIVTLTVCKAVLAFVKGLTVKMQDSCNDILGVFSDIKDVRLKIEEKHAKWFQEACQISEKLDITVQKPRTCQVQRNRANTPAETVEDYDRRNLTMPFLDHLINELEVRFGSGNKKQQCNAC